MKYIVEFEVQDGNCELYKQIDPNNCEAACKACPLKGAEYCMDFNMHTAEIVNVTVK